MNREEQDGFLKIGYTGDEPFPEMHRPRQTCITFRVWFSLQDLPNEERDYRPCLSRIWKVYLDEQGLSASICHFARHLESGVAPAVTGFVWRHKGRECLLSLKEPEIAHLIKLLRDPEAEVTKFSVTKLITKSEHGLFAPIRRHLLTGGHYSEEDCTDN